MKTLQPIALWNYFHEITQIPRPSKKEERIIEFMMQYGKKLGLPTTKDEAGNVIIKKPASKGMENKIPIYVFALNEENSLIRALNGEKIGTIIRK